MIYENLMDYPQDVNLNHRDDGVAAVVVTMTKTMMLAMLLSIVAVDNFEPYLYQDWITGSYNHADDLNLNVVMMMMIMNLSIE